MCVISLAQGSQHDSYSALFFCFPVRFPLWRRQVKIMTHVKFLAGSFGAQQGRPLVEINRLNLVRSTCYTMVSAYTTI